MLDRKTIFAGAVSLIFCLNALAAPPATGPATQPATAPAARTVRVVEPALKVDGATPQQAEWLKAFVPADPAFEATLADAKVDEEWRAVRVTFASPVRTQWAENNVVPCELYLPRESPATRPAATTRPAKMPAVIVLDILDGSALVARGMARGLAAKGIAALYVPMPCYGPRKPADGSHNAYYADHPEKSVDRLRQTVMDVRRAKAVLAALPEVDAERIAITGVSLGGITAALVAGVDGTFYRVVPVLAGGDWAAITFHANREGRRAREAYLAKGIDQAKLTEMLKPVEPLSFAGRIKPATCLMINAAEDEVIPRACTDALNKAIGAPTLLFVPSGHYTAALFLQKIRDGVAEFILGNAVEKL